MGRQWDLLVIGGGITGAGIALEAARLGLQVLLVEAKDFAWGTSSRSSKMVHGGVRYLANLQFGTTIASVRERDRLLHDASGLVNPLEFVVPIYERDRAVSLQLRVGLWLYNRLSSTHEVCNHDPSAMATRFPGIQSEGLRGGWSYTDAETDDSRLVLRVLREAGRAGATVLNYAAATGLIRESGRVCGVHVTDALTGAVASPRARAVVNATGVWVDKLRAELGRPAKMRPLRGSHLVFARERLPVSATMLFRNQDDGRFIYIYPWQGATLVGTTDLDHRQDLACEPRITKNELTYLLRSVADAFPRIKLGPEDLLSTYAGIRPVIADGESDPSKATREHAVWREEGLCTVTGGKLTTFRQIALDTLRKLRPDLPEIPRLARNTPIFTPPPVDLGHRIAKATGAASTPKRSLRLLGRYGADVAPLLDAAATDEMTEIPGTDTLWAELRFAARHEAVVHLDDLLLRRSRVGLLLARGGEAILPRVREICADELGWDSSRWESEICAYTDLWRRCYSLPKAP
ncbi:MAG TPA: glycerol-3-phosphate dehydrogenase/oxidase [Nannocystis exedens]|nr:glycerol-3-phosphate dehydrogenase/oxidase [Nannocystis exedens]